MILCWLFIYRLCILHSGIMLPRFHDSSSDLRHLAFRVLELCCLDSMFLVSFAVFEFCIPHSGIMLPRFYVPFSFYGMCILNYGIMLPRFHDSNYICDNCILHFGIILPRFHVPSSFMVFKILHSSFRNYVASILCSFFFLGMCILELCRLDSIITDYLRTVFGIQRIYYTVIMLP